ncbi:ABC transporter substrate-binding protein [Ilumatobacter sp.]|uniref:ABC transporter substrate-binding protein n=1 Tax=Ilumatobacter sp. TaxID=1967498 RepID=UPI003C4D8DB1
MTTRSSRRTRRVTAAMFSFALVAAACGSSDDGGDDTDTTEASDDTAAEASDDAVAEGDDTDTTEAADAEATDDTAAADGGDEAAEPAGEATGEPIKIGVQNLEGDPAGSFPEYSVAVQAAADYINAELGGLGGRPIEIELCKSIVAPDDSQRCANELSADGIELALSTLNFFGNHFSIYQGSDIPVVVGTPLTIADFTSEGVYSVGAGGGCLGVHTGLIEFATNQLEELEGIDVETVSVPWADTPPGVVCYNDLEAKPLDVLNGTEPGDSARAGEKPELTHIGIPIAPASPDVTPQATEVLENDPDVIVYSAQGSDCWNFLDALGRLGWTAEETPLVLSSSCTDFEAMRAAGELAEGVYLVGSSSGMLSPLDSLEGKRLDEATVYQEKGAEYGMSEDDIFKTFASAGFSAMMNIWQFAQEVDGEVTGQSIADALAATDGTADTFGSTPLDCAGAPEPYVSVCNASVGANVWDGEKLELVIDEFSGLDLVAGTELRPGG